MSYDLTIRGDRGINKSRLRAQLVECGLSADSDDHLLLVISGEQCADMDLVWETHNKGDQPSDAVNCIQVHIPYAFLESRLPEIAAQCVRIANTLKWKVFDEQEGKYVTE